MTPSLFPSKSYDVAELTNSSSSPNSMKEKKKKKRKSTSEGLSKSATQNGASEGKSLRRKSLGNEPSLSPNVRRSQKRNSLAMVTLSKETGSSRHERDSQKKASFKEESALEEEQQQQPKTKGQTEEDKKSSKNLSSILASPKKKPSSKKKKRVSVATMEGIAKEISRERKNHKKQTGLLDDDDDATVETRSSYLSNLSSIHSARNNNHFDELSISNHPNIPSESLVLQPSTLDEYLNSEKMANRRRSNKDSYKASTTKKKKGARSVSEEESTTSKKSKEEDHSDSVSCGDDLMAVVPEDNNDDDSGNSSKGSIGSTTKSRGGGSVKEDATESASENSKNEKKSQRTNDITTTTNSSDENEQSDHKDEKKKRGSIKSTSKHSLDKTCNLSIASTASTPPTTVGESLWDSMQDLQHDGSNHDNSNDHENTESSDTFFTDFDTDQRRSDGNASFVSFTSAYNEEDSLFDLILTSEIDSLSTRFNKELMQMKKRMEMAMHDERSRILTDADEKLKKVRYYRDKIRTEQQQQESVMHQRLREQQLRAAEKLKEKDQCILTLEKKLDGLNFEQIGLRDTMVLLKEELKSLSGTWEQDRTNLVLEINQKDAQIDALQEDIAAMRIFQEKDKEDERQEQCKWNSALLEKDAKIKKLEEELAKLKGSDTEDEFCQTNGTNSAVTSADGIGKSRWDAYYCESPTSPRRQVSYASTSPCDVTASAALLTSPGSEL